MNKLSLAITGLVLLAAAGTVPQSSLASVTDTTIQRCRGANGVDIYTDSSCAALGAQPAPMSSGLVRRIAATGEDAGYRTSIGPGVPSGTIPTRRSPASGCARSPTQLAMDLEAAFALGDVNRIAESYHWVGLSQSQGTRIMQRLERLGEKPLMQAHYLDAHVRSGWLQVADARAGFAGSGGMMQLVFGEGLSSSVLDFDVQRYHGCYFVRFL